MFGYVILVFVLYFLYQFVVKFILPIWRTTKTVRENIQNMKQNQSAPASQQTSTSEERIKTFTEKAGDYIDFEDIKGKK